MAWLPTTKVRTCVHIWSCMNKEGVPCLSFSLSIIFTYKPLYFFFNFVSQWEYFYIENNDTGYIIFQLILSLRLYSDCTKLFTNLLIFVIFLQTASMIKFLTLASILLITWHIAASFIYINNFLPIFL